MEFDLLDEPSTAQVGVSLASSVTEAVLGARARHPQDDFDPNPSPGAYDTEISSNMLNEMIL